MFTIDFDPHRQVLRITATGFWSLATLASFSVTMLARATAAKLLHGDFATLIDLRDYPVQAPDVARGVEQLLKQAMRITTAPVVTITGSQLLKMQAERVLKADHSHIFLTLGEAQDWLDAHWSRTALAA